MSSADEQYEQQNDRVSGDAPTGEYQDDDYQLRQGQSSESVPVTKGAGEDPIDPANADSDETLAQDEANAIDQSNIIDERTRGAAPTQGTYAEPGDEEGLGGPDDGRSRVAGGPN